MPDIPQWIRAAEPAPFLAEGFKMAAAAEAEQQRIDAEQQRIQLAALQMQTSQQMAEREFQASQKQFDMNYLQKQQQIEIEKAYNQSRLALDKQKGEQEMALQKFQLQDAMRQSQIQQQFQAEAAKPGADMTELIKRFGPLLSKDMGTLFHYMLQEKQLARLPEMMKNLPEGVILVPDGRGGYKTMRDPSFKATPTVPKLTPSQEATKQILTQNIKEIDRMLLNPEQKPKIAKSLNEQRAQMVRELKKLDPVDPSLKGTPTFSFNEKTGQYELTASGTVADKAFIEDEQRNVEDWVRMRAAESGSSLPVPASRASVPAAVAMPTNAPPVPAGTNESYLSPTNVPASRDWVYNQGTLNASSEQNRILGKGRTASRKPTTDELLKQKRLVEKLLSEGPMKYAPESVKEYYRRHPEELLSQVNAA